MTDSNSSFSETFMNSESASPTSPSSKSWKPLTRDQRRVLGVLIEKAKTTPDAYPMTLNGIRVGCNQKSNRSPLLELPEHVVEETLYELRELGCVIEVHSGGRVPKFKHEAYEWLGVEKAELGVMAELLLRGEQSIGDLRARAARMEKSITGLEELRPILGSLIEKHLIVELTPAGRGQIVTHHLYQSDELSRLKSEFSEFAASERHSEPVRRPESAIMPSESAQRAHTSQMATSPTAGDFDGQPDPRISVLEQRIVELEQRVEESTNLLKQLSQQVLELKTLIES